MKQWETNNEKIKPFIPGKLEQEIEKKIIMYGSTKCIQCGKIFNYEHSPNGFKCPHCCTKYIVEL